MPAPAAISRFVNKTVAFRFGGRDLSFHLSHALFSSFDIDDGTRLLLKSVAQKVDLVSLRSVLDIGCGIGVLGACIASGAPEAQVLMQDRDSLATAFAAENSRANGLQNVSISNSLAFHGLRGRTFDLVTSNLPAKAGKPVLRSLLRHSAGCLSGRGVAAIVIVSTLADYARETLEALGLPVVHREQTRAYSVLHFAAGSTAPETDDEREALTPYIRAAPRFSMGSISYTLQTAYSLPDFDTLGHATELALEVLRDAADCTRVLVWNPGQGHIPVGLISLRQDSKVSMVIAGRDVLECEISRVNLVSRGTPPEGLFTLPTEEALGGAFSGISFDLFAAVPKPIPLVPWHEDLCLAAPRLLKKGGELFVVGTSTEVHRFLEKCHGLRLKTSRKRLGFRAVILSNP